MNASADFCGNTQGKTSLPTFHWNDNLPFPSVVTDDLFLQWDYQEDISSYVVYYKYISGWNHAFYLQISLFAENKQNKMKKLSSSIKNNAAQLIWIALDT